MPEPDKRSWWKRTFGRSILKVIVGDFFEKKRNTVSILAIIIVGTVCYVVVAREKYDFVNYLVNIIFVVVGFYFGSKPGTDDDADEGD
jgi:hypothetical protein